MRIEIWLPVLKTPVKLIILKKKKRRMGEIMNKTVRFVLYTLSLLTVAGLIAAVAAAGGRSRAQESLQQDHGTEDAVMTAENISEDEGAKDSEIWETEVRENVDSAKEEAAENTGAEGTEAEIIGTEGIEAENTQTEDAEQTKDGVATILFTGDVLFANAFQAGYDASGIEGVISKELLQELKAADILMINNEFPFSDRGAQMPDKQYTFRCSPSYVGALNEMGVDVVSLANNHTLDYGKEALSDTFAALDGAGILYGGAGENVERAEMVQTFEVNGRTYGFLAVSRVIPTGDWKVENSAPGLFSCYDDTRLLELIKEAKETCDFLAVYPHWGVEYQEYPESYQTQIAERCIDAGADVIVGSHTHCLQGAEFIDGKPVCYSLGNFVFGQNIDRSAILKVTVDASGNAAYQYLPTYAEGGVTYLAAGDRAAQICRYIDSISPQAAVASDGKLTQE